MPKVERTEMAAGRGWKAEEKGVSKFKESDRAENAAKKVKKKRCRKEGSKKQKRGRGGG